MLPFLHQRPQLVPGVHLGVLGVGLAHVVAACHLTKIVAPKFHSQTADWHPSDCSGPGSHVAGHRRAGNPANCWIPPIGCSHPIPCSHLDCSCDPIGLFQTRHCSQRSLHHSLQKKVAMFPKRVHHFLAGRADSLCSTS